MAVRSHYPEYPYLKALRKGEVIEIDGIKLVMEEGEIKKGDFYVGERNTGPHLLIAKIVDGNLGCIYPDSPEYPYDLHECVKVREV